MLWRFLNILYYKELIKKILLNSKNIKITCTSSKNKDLNLAICSLNDAQKIGIKYLNLDNLELTSPHKFGGHYDLIDSKYLSNKLIIKILAYIYRLFNISKGTYIKYPNLKRFKNYYRFSDFFSISLSLKSIIHKLKRLIINKSKIDFLKKINLEEKKNFKKILFDRVNWRDLSDYDYKIIVQYVKT